MAGILYPPHIAEKLYLLDASIETFNEDDLNCLNELRIELKNLLEESSGFLSMMAARSKRIKSLSEDEAAQDFSDVIDKTFLKMVSARKEIFGLYMRVALK
ncbi:MAG: hypothetical protein Q9180_007241, partial [Flavoplaca navasiana]